MTKLARLKREALEACSFRGHDMTRFHNSSRIDAYATCKICGKLVGVNAYPAPNDIDIGGNALALGCKD